MSNLGRRGRAWVSQPGNLYATLLLPDPAPAELAAQLSFVGWLAVYDAILNFAADAPLPLALKWPNDVLLRGRKVAGNCLVCCQPQHALVEGEGSGSHGGEIGGPSLDSGVTHNHHFHWTL